MKLTIDIPNTALRESVEGEVAKAIAKMAEGLIQEKLDAILLTKLDRLSKNFSIRIDETLKAEISKALDTYLGAGDAAKREYLKHMVSEVVLKQIRLT